MTGSRIFSPEWLKNIGDPRDNVARAQSLNCMATSYAHFLRGYQMNAAEIIRAGLMPAGAATGQTITVSPIPFYGVCEHHMLPFFGTAEITYTAGDYILGLGKFPRVVEALSARMNMQETLTAAIADALSQNLSPRAVTVTLNARHLCLEMRGTETAGAYLKTVRSL